ncbi:hypothetical protein FHX74_000430 [Friedmanniella endophytica]|uniref:Uncharacterized protein n=1 Tax=Microlunatus kandeliicorticis TaxID=1759536 RepID=A0A7W3IPF9_9ACTN|nr:hypothetical protein [Microlunatus kandeliicorticis]MBA8792836.1 hypothetical protein [Microlunatus kandeliicorticis]
MSAFESTGDAADRLTGLLTAIARHTLTHASGTDFADILTYSLAAAAANVGGPDLLLSGRPASWESSRISSLLSGAMGDDPSHWIRLRTEAVTVPLNVAQLVEDGVLHPGLLGLADAVELLGDRYPDLTDDDPRADDYDRDAASLERRYHLSYAEYAERFETVVTAVVSELRLRTSVTVISDADPESLWWDGETKSILNADPLGDPLVDESWMRAHAVVPLPNVTIAPVRTEDGDE